MPIAIIAKIMARELSHLGYAKISHDAKTLMQEAATEFICFIMSEANDQALQGKRKSVTGQDIINACDQMDMKEMVQPMTNCAASPPTSQARAGQGGRAGPWPAQPTPPVPRVRRRGRTDPACSPCRRSRRDSGEPADRGLRGAGNADATRADHDSPFCR